MLSFKKKIGFTLLTFCIFLICLIVVGELLLRHLLENEVNSYGFGPGTLKFSQKYTHGYYRDGRHPLGKTDKRRIVWLGDSFNFGAGIKNPRDIYLFRLETYLNKKYNNAFEFINISQGGWNLDAYYRRLKKEALRYNPEMIIMGFVFNDVDLHKAYIHKNHVKLVFFSDALEWYLRRHSYLFYFLETRLNTLLVKYVYEKDFVEYLNELYTRKNTTFLESLNYFRYISTTCKQHDIPLLVVILPFFSKSKTEQHAINRNVMKLSRLVAPRCTDIFDANTIFIDKNYSRYTVSQYDMHPNEEANRIIFETLLDQGIEKYFK